MKSYDLTVLQKKVAAHNEWLLIYDFGKTFTLKSTEIEFEVAANKDLVSFLIESGFQTWRIMSAETDVSTIVFELTRNFAREITRVKLIPRTKAEEFSRQIEVARQERANNIAGLVESEVTGSKLIRVELNKANGRYAQIILEKKNRVRIAVLADVSDSLTPELLLSVAVFWLARLQRRKKRQIGRIWILSEKRNAKNLVKIHACLTNKWKSRIGLREIVRKQIGTVIAENRSIPITGLWKFKPKDLKPSNGLGLSKMSREIVGLAPGKIDCRFSKKGETLRYLGLSFLRVRKMLGGEKAWFGVGGRQQVLNAESFEEFYDLIENIKKYRRHDPPNSQHIYYQEAPEAWLESILRKNIKLLDANLILSPIYNQFRISRDRVDLLALRKDGRLVIIELKVSVDREMIFQAVDYWRKIELQRRKGMFSKVRFFGDTEIADKATIVYLVAPTLSYHRDFDFLSKTISNEIEVFRFDLAEGWRKNIKVLERRRVN